MIHTYKTELELASWPSRVGGGIFIERNETKRKQPSFGTHTLIRKGENEWIKKTKRTGGIPPPLPLPRRRRTRTIQNKRPSRLVVVMMGAKESRLQMQIACKAKK